MVDEDLEEDYDEFMREGRYTAGKFSALKFAGFIGKRAYKQGCEDEREKHLRITVDESAQPELRAWFKKELEDAKKQERERMSELHKTTLIAERKKVLSSIFKELDKLIKYKDAQGEWCDYMAIKKLKAKLKED